MRVLGLLLPAALLLASPALSTKPKPRPTPITKPTRPPIGTSTQAPRGAPGAAARATALANRAFARPTVGSSSTPPIRQMPTPQTIQRPSGTPGPGRPGARPIPTGRPATLTLTAPAPRAGAPPPPSPVRYPCCGVTTAPRPAAAVPIPRGLPSTPRAVLPGGGTTSFSFTRVDAAVKVER